jgi:cytosine/adenosine deaminase-related metal-dependent hydrolase
MLVNIQPSKDFAQQLKNLWWRLDRAIDLPILKASALAGCADAAMAGVTSLVDHYAGPEAIDGSLTVIRKAYEEIGLRGLLCYETTDRNGMDGARPAFGRTSASRRKSPPTRRGEGSTHRGVHRRPRALHRGGRDPRPPLGRR